jgi:hypothetical protein
MKITIADLTVDYSQLDHEALLEEWTWLIGKRKRLIMISAVGDAFLHDPGDGIVYWLDIGQGQLHRIADNMEAFEVIQRTKDFFMVTLSAPLIHKLRKDGIELIPGQVYSFKTPPVMGGHYIPSNFRPVDIEIHFSLSGRFHKQIKNYPISRHRTTQFTDNVET